MPNANKQDNKNKTNKKKTNQKKLLLLLAEFIGRVAFTGIQ